MPMKLRCDRDLLADALQTVQRGVSTRPGIPALTGVLVSVGEGGLSLTTTDLEVTTQVDVAVEAAEEGVALVPARILADMVKTLPPDSVEMVTDGGQARVTCRSFEGNLRLLPAEDFPALRESAIEVPPGLVAAVGPNAQGKTNLLEAVHYLMTLSSPRASSDEPLVRRGADRAYLRGEVETASGRGLVEGGGPGPSPAQPTPEGARGPGLPTRPGGLGRRGGPARSPGHRGPGAGHGRRRPS